MDICSRDDGHELRMERQHRAQIRKRRPGKSCLSMIGVVGHVGLNKGEFEFVVAKSLNVVNRAGRHLPRAPNAALVQVLVDD
jgi:hypothetical protein